MPQLKEVGKASSTSGHSYNTVMIPQTNYSNLPKKQSVKVYFQNAKPAK